jgi:hypothetical protein
MPLTRDVVKIPLDSLSDLSKTLYRTDIFEYQLRLLFMRGSDTYTELQRMIKVSFENRIIIIEGPQYDSEDVDIEGPFSYNWRTIFENYMFNKGFIDAIAQLRFVTVNPITIYYQLLQAESKMYGISAAQSKLTMRRLALRKESPSVRLRPQPSSKIDDAKEKYSYLKTTFGDGHVMIERPGEPLAEGFVDDEIPANISLKPDRDHPQGLLINLFPGFPFYAFNYRNIYPKMNDINKLIESGLMVVFVRAFERKTIMEIEREYRSFFTDWSIPVIDYVTPDRLSSINMDSMIPPSENVGGFKYVNLPSFFIIQRPIDKFHSCPWAGINTDRRRGLVGVPWARDMDSGMDLASPQADDGFLNYFIKEGVQRRLEGKATVQVFFPLCTIHTQSEINRVISKVSKVFGRQLKLYSYDIGNVAGIYLKSMGEWILLRTVLRKSL